MDQDVCQLMGAVLLLEGWGGVWGENVTVCDREYTTGKRESK
jgi:hypothetical protein